MRINFSPLLIYGDYNPRHLNDQEIGPRGAKKTEGDQVYLN
jgi:hypothetical protein